MVSILYPDQVFAPCWGVLVHHTSEAGFQLLIGLAVSFRVISRCQAGSGSDESAEFPPELGHNLGPPVWNNVFPCETGSPVTKSMKMSDHGLEGMGSGWSSPVRAWENVLLRAQTEQASMYSRTSGSMAGHQNLREITNMVLLTPGWQESSEVWAQWITCGRSSAGTNRRLSGQPRGEAPPFACLTWFSIGKITAPTTQFSGRIVSVYLVFGSGLNSRDRTSGLTFLDPGL